eukprot:gb/GEZN01006101.1/.p1 GENE.gb/GEZN01006101.1/~~gb/GEZN01006101.1/.p1  ORF type:complete len:395 (-),score=68.06 gb/GEZN01006101.1/:473-1657(-)
MGIKGLMQLISDNAPNAVKEQDMKAYFGRAIAIDASMSIYQFLIAVRTGVNDQMLTNEKGEVTSHLQGLFYRTIRMLENGVKPVYVFDGKPPTLKSVELEKRKERREAAEANLEEAKDTENQEDQNKFKRMLVKVTKEQNDDCIKLLQLMGIPVVQAPCEAEAQCAELCRGGLVYATATEDMDALTFGTKKLLRHMTSAASRKLPIMELDLETVLKGLELTMEEFIDMCILCGCDYTVKLPGIGPMTALKHIKKYKSIEKLLPKLDSKTKVPEHFMYNEAKALFVTPDVTPASEVKLKWGVPDEEGLVKFLVVDKGFAEDRVRSGIAKIKKSKGQSSQKRMESFFGAAIPNPNAAKRKTPDSGKGKGKGKGKDKPKSGKKEKKEDKNKKQKTKE